MAERDNFSGQLLLRTLGETRELGRRIAKGLAAGDVIALEGDLGAGKTTLARAILRALGVTAEIPSPSFALVQEYETPRLRIFHFDLYRIESIAEVDELGFEEAQERGAILLEWPERAQARIPSHALRIGIEIVGETVRAVQFFGGARWAQLLASKKA
ncbi:MAG: tRNA (adenosine(37)-N6)-threonylcarbamoyltransferase complex ATPase subunit type 1 TsaE [Rhizomicrobium sp.]